MSFIIQVTNTPAAANTVIAATTSPAGNAAEAALLARLIPVIQAEVTAMGAANQVQVYAQGSHTEKTCSVEFQIDKATPFANAPIQLSNASPAN